MSMPEDSNDTDVDKLLAELENEVEESPIIKTIKDIKKEESPDGNEWDEYTDTVKNYKDGSHDIIKDEDTYD